MKGFTLKTSNVLCALAALTLRSIANATDVSYKQLASFSIGGDGGWDYLIAGPGGKLFISRGTHVMVVDEASGKVVGDIPDTLGVHGIALDRALGVGFTSNGRDNSVTEFDLKSFKTIRKIPVSGQNPDCIIFDPVAGVVVTCNGRSGDCSIIDPKEGKELGKVQIGGKLEFAGSDRAGNVFVNNDSKSEITELNPKTMQIIKTWSIAPGEGPSGLAIDAAHHRLFSVTDGKMIVSDSEAGKVVATVEIGEGPDATAFDPKLGLAFSSNGESATLSVVKEVSPTKFSVLETVPTEAGARTMALDPETHKLFLVTAKFDAAPAGTQSDSRRRSMTPGSFKVLVFGPEK